MQGRVHLPHAERAEHAGGAGGGRGRDDERGGGSAG